MEGPWRPEPGGIVRLDALLEEYAEAVEADLLRYYAVDLGDLWRGGLTYRRLGVLLDTLPPESALRTARRNDLPAEALTAERPDDAPHGPWAQSEYLLAQIADTLALLVWQNASMYSASRPPPPTPIPRPGVVRSVNRQISDKARAYLQRLRDERTTP